jgi:hypothetical protein
MLLGYRDLYIAGSFCEVRPASFWEQFDLFFEKRLTGSEQRTYRTFGYLTPEEVRYAAVILGKPLDDFHAAPSNTKGSARWAIPPISYYFALVSFITFKVSNVICPHSSRGDQTRDVQTSPVTEFGSLLIVVRFYLLFPSATTTSAFPRDAVWRGLCV